MKLERKTLADLKKVAYVGDNYLDGPPRALVVNHQGLGAPEFRKGPGIEEYLWQKAGALVLFPYSHPWGWMNREARAFVDELIADTFRLYGLGPEIPIIAAGGSMGGCSALLQARYSRHSVVGCLAIYPVCDTAYHFTERPDLPRTMFLAFGGYEGTFEEALAEQSPLAQAEQMPDIPYCLIHGDADKAVGKEMHSDKFVRRLRDLGRKVDYLEVPGYGHEGWANQRVVLDKIVGFVTSLIPQR